MPELPEVEIIVNDLQKVLPGLKIRDVWTDHTNYIKYKVFDDFKKEIVGKEILKVERRGKNILIRLSHGRTLLIHQKMTGHLLYGKWKQFKISNLKPKNHISKIKSSKNAEWVAAEPGPLRDDPENRFIHLVFSLSNGNSLDKARDKQLALCDMRKFAKALLWPTDKLEELKDIKSLGIEPFDKNFTFNNFKKLISPKRGIIKTVLMDQKLVVGIGNIYSDEILWKADVHPLKKANELSEKEIEKIYKVIKPILKRAIHARGSSYVDYRDAFGRKGKYQDMHYAYQMDGTKCQKRDGGILEKIKVGSRSAHFCPVHQKL